MQSVNKSELKTLIKNPWTSDGKEFSERIWGRGEKLTTSLRDNLIRDIARGNNPKESARNIQRLFDVSKASATRLVFTETAAVNAKATQDSYEKLGVKQYQILATLDLKTSDICRNMDSKIFDYKDYRIGITAPPFHPNCRSDTVPYFGDEFEKEIDQGMGRMARDPKTGKSEPVENLSYEDWHKKYVVENNDEEEYKQIISILGYKVVENVEKYKNIKYNNLERYEQIKREVKTIEMINNKGWEEPFKERLKSLYYEFRKQGHEFNMHGLERTTNRIQRGKFTKEKVIEVLNKDFNKRQFKDDRPVKFYNDIQVIYLDNEIEVHNVIDRGKNWKVDEKLYDYNK